MIFKDQKILKQIASLEARIKKLESSSVSNQHLRGFTPIAQASRILKVPYYQIQYLVRKDIVPNKKVGARYYIHYPTLKTLIHQKNGENKYKNQSSPQTTNGQIGYLEGEEECL